MRNARHARHSSRARRVRAGDSSRPPMMMAVFALAELARATYNLQKDLNNIAKYGGCQMTDIKRS
jgi:hypothetical protein